MNEQQAENLRILIRHMENNVARTLQMRTYFGPCGTPACAIGEACMVPALAAQGLVTTNDCDREWCPLTGSRETGRIFGLDSDGGKRLFGPRAYNAWGSNDVAPQEWATEARKVLAESGYSMEAPTDPAFNRFMETVRLPVLSDGEQSDETLVAIKDQYLRVQLFGTAKNK